MIRVIAAGLVNDGLTGGLIIVGLACWAAFITVIILMIRGGTQGRDDAAQPPGIGEGLGGEWDDVEDPDEHDEKDHGHYWG